MVSILLYLGVHCKQDVHCKDVTVVPSVRAKSVPYIDVSLIKGYYYTEVALYHIISSISVK